MKNNDKYNDWVNNKDYLLYVRSIMMHGAMEKDLASRIGISQKTLIEWKNRFPKFRAAIELGKEITIAKIENALIKRAMGYMVREKKTIEERGRDQQAQRNPNRRAIAENRVRVETIEKHIVPDVNAITLALNNLAPKDWKRNRDSLELDDGETGKEMAITLNIIRPKKNKTNESSNNPKFLDDDDQEL
jgi:DNA-binding XRE family transcriptional regulator